MDFKVNAMENLMGGGMVARAAVLDSLSARATSTCSATNVTECDLQSLRRASGGTNAMCPGECTDTVEMGSTATCLTPLDYPPEDVRWADGGGPHQQASIVHSDVWVREPSARKLWFCLFNAQQLKTEIAVVACSTTTTILRTRICLALPTLM